MARGDKGSRAQTPLGEGVAFEPVDYPAETVYPANASTCSDAAVSGPESVSNSERNVKKTKKIKYCSKCSAHTTKVQIKNHKNKCPFKDCLCKDCIPIIVRRDSTALAQSDRRRKNPAKSTQQKPSKRKIPPKCTKCRIHGITVNFKGHKENCKMKLCTCVRCMVADERRFNTRTAQFRRRSQMSTNEKDEWIFTTSLPLVSSTTTTTTTASAATPSTAALTTALDTFQDPSTVTDTTNERDSNCNESAPQSSSRARGNLFFSSTDDKPTPRGNSLTGNVEADTSNGTPPEVGDKKPRQRSCVKRRNQTDLFSTIAMSHSCDSKNCKYVFCDRYDERKTRRARRRAARGVTASAAAMAVDGTMTAADSTGLKNYNDNSVGPMSGSSSATAASPPLPFPSTTGLRFPLVSPPATVKKVQFPPLTDSTSPKGEENPNVPQENDSSNEKKFPWDSLEALTIELNDYHASISVGKYMEVKYGFDSYLLLYVILKHSNNNVVTAFRIITKAEDSKDVLKNSVRVLGDHCRIKPDYYALLNAILKISNLNVLTALRRIVQDEQEFRAAGVRDGYFVPWQPICPVIEPCSPSLVAPSPRSSECDTSSQHEEAMPLDTFLPSNEHSMDKSSVGSSTNSDEMTRSNADCSTDIVPDTMEPQSISTTVPEEPVTTQRDEVPKRAFGPSEMKIPRKKSTLLSSESSLKPISLLSEDSDGTDKAAVNPSLNWMSGESQQNPLLVRQYLEAHPEMRNTRSRRAPLLSSPTMTVGYPDISWPTLCKQPPPSFVARAAGIPLTRRRGGGVSTPRNHSPDCDPFSHEEASSVESVVTVKDKSPESNIQCNEATKNSDCSSEIEAEDVDETTVEPISLFSSVHDRTPQPDETKISVNKAKLMTLADGGPHKHTPAEDSNSSIPLTWRAGEYPQNPMFLKRYFEDRDTNGRKWIDREAPFGAVVNFPLTHTPYGQPFLATSSMPLYFNVQNSVLRAHNPGYTIPIWNGAPPEGVTAYAAVTPASSVSPSESSSTQSKGDYRGNDYPCYYPYVFFKDYPNPTLSM